MRRLAVALFFLTLLPTPLVAHAQQPGRVYRLGILAAYGPVSKFPDPVTVSFLEGLRARVLLAVEPELC
jgi:hypothetical protein